MLAFYITTRENLPQSLIMPSQLKNPNIKQIGLTQTSAHVQTLKSQSQYKYDKMTNHITTRLNVTNNKDIFHKRNLHEYFTYVTTLN